MFRPFTFTIIIGNNWTNIYHVSKCFLFILLVLGFFSPSFPALSSFMWGFHMITLYILSWHINYTTFQKIVEVAFELAMYILTNLSMPSNNTIKLHAQIRKYVTLYSKPLPSCPLWQWCHHFIYLYAIITSYIVTVWV